MYLVCLFIYLLYTEMCYSFHILIGGGWVNSSLQLVCVRALFVEQFFESICSLSSSNFPLENSKLLCLNVYTDYHNLFACEISL